MPIENLKDLEKSLRLESGMLQKAIDNEEKVSIELPELKIFTESEHSDLLNNTKKDAGVVATEIMLKEMKTSQNLDYEGRKVPDNFMKAFKEKIIKESGVEPEKKFTELKGSFEKVQENLVESEKKFTDLQSLVNSDKKERSKNDFISGNFNGDLILKNKDALVIFNGRVKTEINEDGKYIFFKDGSVLKNETTQNPLEINDVIKDVMSDFYKKVEGGKGGGDNKGGGKVGSLEDFKKRMNDEGVNSGSAEYTMKMSKEVADGTLKI